MIVLDVKEYCQNCPDFDPEVTKEILYSDDFSLGRRKIIYTTVRCKYSNRCHCCVDAFIQVQMEKKK